jgi:hypothetical protein
MTISITGKIPSRLLPVSLSHPCGGGDHCCNFCARDQLRPSCTFTWTGSGSSGKSSALRLWDARTLSALCDLSHWLRIYSSDLPHWCPVLVWTNVNLVARNMPEEVFSWHRFALLLGNTQEQVCCVGR